jgi:hypothetical protein
MRSLSLEKKLAPVSVTHLSASTVGECHLYDTQCNNYNNIYYLLTAVGLSPGGSTHLHTDSTQNNTKQIIWKSAGRAPSLRVFTLAFALQLREKHGKTTVRVRETSVRLLKTSVRVQYTYYQDSHALQIRHKHTHYKTHTYAHTLTPTITKQYKKTTTVQCKNEPSTRSTQMKYNNTQFGTVVAVTY